MEKKPASDRTRSKIVIFFIVAAVVIVPCVFIAVSTCAEKAWFEPARIYKAANDDAMRIFEEQGWEGHAFYYHIERRARINGLDLGDEELPLLFPSLRKLVALERIELYDTKVTEEGIAALQAEFPDCWIVVRDSTRDTTPTSLPPTNQADLPR